MFIIDSRSADPIYQQIIDQTKEQVLKGILKAGTQLPPVRQLAGMLSINPNTVSRAYQELEREKIIETIRGKGTFVCEISKRKVDEEKMDELYRTLKGICVELHYMGLSEEEVMHKVEEIFKGLKNI